MVDKLEEIVELQTKFMDALGVPRIQKADFGLVQKMMPQMMFALVCELGEIGDEINWKHWKKTQKEVNMDALRMELIDAFHFLMEMMLMVGMNAETISMEYRKKMLENIRRQQSGY